MSEFRLVRLGEQIRDEVSTMIMRGQIKDPRVSTFLSINRVEVTRDLAFAKVYVSSFMSDKQTKLGVKGLESAAGFIQSTLSRKLRLRQFPKLQFIADSSIKEGFNMVHKIDAIVAHDQEVAASQPQASEDTESESTEA
ncbi:MAG: 30S ribosome-binding factor RbfA [Treponemataceae bacterium]|nr:30S ribosome-binding factor RbfA [Treponemataceae bacterium]